ncbi:MAG: ferritin-like domain-containing protein [Duganella sp.]
MLPLPDELRARALHCLLLADPAEKVAAVAGMAEAVRAGACRPDPAAVLHASGSIPGRPPLPELVLPSALGRRGMNTAEGRAMLIHALAHIEFNAINLALDALWRFGDLPLDYYSDWLQVAEEEAMHFSLVAEHLQQLGYAYGDFTAHGSLWEMVAKTTGDVLARMALVPRTLEARGLDANPPMRAKLAQAGDLRAAAILDIILRDEIGHVAIGNRWYRHLCAERGLEPRATYVDLSIRYHAPVLRGPFNTAARLQAGFTEEEVNAL